jgi:hypothetical protein
MNRYGVVLFHTTSAAVQAEKALLAAGVAVKLIPTPREFSSDCGMALRFRWEGRGQVENILHGAVETARVELLQPHQGGTS